MFFFLIINIFLYKYSFGAFAVLLSFQKQFTSFT